MLEFYVLIVGFLVVFEVVFTLLEPNEEFEVFIQHLEAETYFFQLIPNVMKGVPYRMCVVRVVSLEEVCHLICENIPISKPKVFLP